MLPLQAHDRLARCVVRQLGNLLKRAPNRLLVLLVQVGPPLPVEAQPTRGLAAPEDPGDVTVTVGRLGEPLPHGRPRALAPGQPRAGDHVGLIRRVELQLLPAASAEGVPTVCSHTSACRVRVSQPPQKVANDVAREQAIEVVGRQLPAFELSNRRQRNLRQRPLQGIRRSPVSRHLQAKRLARRKEGVHRPVAAVRVMPQRAPEQQFHQRLQAVRTLLPRTQLLARHARQVDDCRPIVRKTRHFEGAVHDAPHPDRGTGAPLRVVVAEDEVLVDALQECVDQRQPLPLRVRPQDRSRAASDRQAPRPWPGGW